MKYRKTFGEGSQKVFDVDVMGIMVTMDTMDTMDMIQMF